MAMDGLTGLAWDRSVGASLRRRLHGGEGRLPAVLGALRRTTTTPLLVVATCERLEVVLDGAADPRRLAGALAGLFGADTERLREAQTVRRGVAVAAHLLSVAAGLESRLLGEAEILGQVRRAYLAAQRAATLSPVLHAVARGALRAGKRVRHETDLGIRPAGVVALTLEAIDRHAGSRRSTVLLFGTGRLARRLLAALVARGHRVAVAGREPERAGSLAAEHGAGVATPGEAAAAAPFEVVVAATDHQLDLAPWAPRFAAPALLLDLGWPPNLEPGVESERAGAVVRLDELAGAVSAPAAAWQIVDDELARLRAWCRRRARWAAAPSYRAPEERGAA